MRELAFLNKGIRLVVVDKTIKKEKSYEFKYDGGLIEFVEFLNQKKEKLKNKNGNNLFKKASSLILFSKIEALNLIDEKTSLDGIKQIFVPFCLVEPFFLNGLIVSPFLKKISYSFPSL